MTFNSLLTESAFSKKVTLMTKSVTIIIPTFKRANLLSHVLSALKDQSFRGFDVLVVVKPSGDGTENIVRKFDSLLKIRLIFQTSGYFVDALNLGIKNATGDILVFLDDDAVPAPDWLKNIVDTYSLSNVGGVAGEVVPARLNELGVIQLLGNSEVIPQTKDFLEEAGRKLWSCPLDGLENYLVYVSKAGIVNYNFDIANRAQNQITKSLLGMGANMSVLNEAVQGFEFPNSWVLGLSNEQFLGWHIWKKGYTLFFNPHAKVYHLAHGQTLTRNVSDNKKDVLRQVESQLLFHRLYGQKRSVSKMHQITWLLFDTAKDLKKLCRDKEFFRLNCLKSKFLSEAIGNKWLLSKSFGGAYTPLGDLEKIISKGKESKK